MATKINHLLMCYPLRPPALLEEVKTMFKTVLDYPQRPGNDYQVDPLPLPTPEAYAQADAMVVFALPKNLTHIDQVPNLKWIQVVGAGYNHITETPFWRSIPDSHPIILANATGVHVRSIAEHVIMYILALTHKLPQSHEMNRRDRRWPAFDTFDKSGLFIREMSDMTVGILGYGHLGRECARLSSAFGSRIVACSREGSAKPIQGYHVAGTGDPEATLPQKWFRTETASLHAFLAECDVVVNCLPHSAQTHHILGEAELRAMKNDSIFINIGRGNTVDQVALVEALKAPDSSESGALKIGAAGLDVTDPEPLPDGHELFTMPNVILTGHTSFASQTLFYKVVDIIRINRERLESGLGAINAVRGKGE